MTAILEFQTRHFKPGKILSSTREFKKKCIEVRNTAHDVETHASAFLPLNISAVGSVQRID